VIPTRLDLIGVRNPAALREEEKEEHLGLWFMSVRRRRHNGDGTGGLGGGVARARRRSKAVILGS
jgi:hypothetical protein